MARRADCDQHWVAGSRPGSGGGKVVDKDGNDRHNDNGQRPGQMGGNGQRPDGMGGNGQRPGQNGNNGSRPGQIGDGGRPASGGGKVVDKDGDSRPNRNGQGEAKHRAGTSPSVDGSGNVVDKDGDGKPVGKGQSRGGVKQARADLGSKKQGLSEAEKKFVAAKDDLANSKNAELALKARVDEAFAALNGLAEQHIAGIPINQASVDAAEARWKEAQKVLINQTKKTELAAAAAGDAEKAVTQANQDVKQAQATLADKQQIAKLKNQLNTGQMGGDGIGQGQAGGGGLGQRPSSGGIIVPGNRSGPVIIGSPFIGPGSIGMAPVASAPSGVVDHPAAVAGLPTAAAPQAGPASSNPINSNPAAAPPSPAFVSVAFRPDLSKSDMAGFLDAYKVTVAEGPSSEGVYRLRLNEPLPPDQFPQLIESMKSQTAIVVNVVAD